MTPQLFPLLLLLLLAGLPATRPAPPTCYSRMLALSREITSDFQSLQATEPSVSALSPHLNEDRRSMQTQFQKFAFGLGVEGDQGWGGNALFLFQSMLISSVFVLYSHPIKCPSFVLPLYYKENATQDIKTFVYN